MGGIKTNFTIFGGTGDLSYRKLFPALYNLFVSGKITHNTRIVAVGRRDYTRKAYVEIIREWTKRFSRVEFVDKDFHEFSEMIVYHKLDFENLEDYQGLSQYFCKKSVQENIFYYAVAPRYFSVISEGLSKLESTGHAKIVVEKPFGETLEEANQLNKNLEQWFSKDDIYHIDHYLGKEMIQNMLSIRFTNPIFSNNWRAKNIEQVQIIASERVGVGSRGGYYDKSGALKDMMQNHLLQILSIVAMERPDDTYSVKERQVQALKQLRPVEKLDIEKHMLLGQYKGYLQEEQVSPDSTTETYAFCKFYVDNERWNGVPFYIMTGKELEEREMSVVITFKSDGGGQTPNVLIFKIQPLEGVSLMFNVKKPGDTNESIQTEMVFKQDKLPEHSINTPEAYERLLYAVKEEDHTWFANWDQIYYSWTYVEELKKAYRERGLKPVSYTKGSKGPSDLSEVLDISGN